MKLREYLTATWAVFGLSAAVAAWQLIAYATGAIPEHILPLVLLLSGSEEAIPVAYDWTLRIAFVSTLALLGSSAVLICLHCLHCYTKRNGDKKHRNA